MHIEEALYAATTTDSRFTALNVPLYLMEAPQDKPEPYVIYQMITLEDPLTTLDLTPIDQRSWLFQFSAYATTYASVANICRTLQQILLGHQDDNISGIILRAERTFRDPDLEAFSKQFDVEVWGKWIS